LLNSINAIKQRQYIYIQRLNHVAYKHPQFLLQASRNNSSSLWLIAL